MPSPHPVLENGSSSTSSGSQELEQYPTLKQSLSASLANGFHEASDRLEGYFGVRKEQLQPSRTTRSNSSQLHGRPKENIHAGTATAALRYLPLPILVLSNEKTVVLANEYMGKVLGLQEQVHEASDEKNDTTAEELLRGRTLNEIGVDIIQDGQRIWVGWDRFLDDVADQLELRHSVRTKLEQRARTVNEEGEDTSTTNGSKRARKFADSTAKEHYEEGKLQRSTDETAVDVILSSQYFDSSNTMSIGRRQVSTGNAQVKAKMIISVWSLEGQRHFTLSFTSIATVSAISKTSNDADLQASHKPPASVRVSSSTVGTPPLPEDATSPSDGGASVFSLPSGKLLTVIPFRELSAPNEANLAAEQSAVQKTSRLKDAILNAMEIPVCAMWKDRSLAFPNKAAMRILHRYTDSSTDESPDTLSRFKCWTGDFSRELTEDEYPLVQLCRTQQPFKSFKMGIKDPVRGATIYDCSGDCYYDEKTGEFLAGMIALKDVTEYASALKEQTEESEQQFELICHTTPNMLWTTTPDGKRDWFSKRWYDFTGLTPKQSLGAAWQTPFHPDDVEETSRKWEHSIATGEEYSTEYRCRRYDGQWRWMLGRALPLRDQKSGKIVKWMGSLSDIHDLVEARQAAKRTREQLLNVIKHAQVTVWAIDRHSRLTFLEGMMLWDQEEKDISAESLGRNIYEVFGRHKGKIDMPLYRKPIEDILSGIAKEQISTHHMDGNGRWFRTRFVPILGKKGIGGAVDESVVDGVVGISMDVSEIKEREAELQSQEEENIRLLSAETAAKEASRLKSQFLANMSHEIRTPIAGIIGMAELLIDTNLDSEQREFGENIQRSANGLLTVINDILDLSKVESGRLDIEEVQFSLSVVIRDVCKMMSFAAERKNLVFESNIEIGMDSDLVVLGDPGRCRQILTNLLTNSIKFTSEGYVKLSVVIKSQTADTIDILFSVEDTGIGIEEVVRKRLFKPFSQADSSTARRFGGTGLGLTICKNLVDLMHGEITLDSILGSGTKATFSIPFNKAQFHGGSSPLVNLASIPERLQSETSVSGCGSDPERILSTPPQFPLDAPGHFTNHKRLPSVEVAAVRPSLTHIPHDHDLILQESERKGIHVLVVEDNAINQQIALKTIKKLGFSVNAVWNGREALDYLLETPTPERPKPNVILMDVQMPILDGYRATHLIRHHSPYTSLPGMRAVPIVAMTASAIQGDREKCERAGMDDYLAKPVKGKTLEKMLVKWALKGRRHGQHNVSYHSKHTDHDSNCHESNPTSTPHKRNLGSSSGPSSQENLRNRVLAEGSRLPNAESEGERGMRRVEAEEKATALRNDKLINTASEDHMFYHHTISPGADTVHSRPQPMTAALTEENMGKLTHEQNSAALTGRLTTTPPRTGELSSSSSLAGEGRANSTTSTLGSSRSETEHGTVASRKFARRNKLNRNDSEMSQLSQLTVTPQSSMEKKAPDGDGWE